MKIGYARVSTDEQRLDMQIEELKRDGCEKIFMDKISGRMFDRPELKKCLDYVREGDMLVVWKLDRLGRSLSDLIRTVNELGQKGVAFKSLKENIDTNTPAGKLVFHIFGALAEFECELIRERTKCGLRVAIANGAKVGRPSKIKDIGTVASLIAKGIPPRYIMRDLAISEPTFYRLKKRVKEQNITKEVQNDEQEQINKI